MNSRPVLWLITGIVFLLSGCDVQEIMDEYASSDEAVFAKEHLALYPGREFEPILGQLDPAIINDGTQGQLEELANYFPVEMPTETVMVGYNWTASTQSWTGTVTYQYEFPSTYLLASVGLTKIDEQLFVNGINLQTMDVSLQEANEFRLDGRGVVGYIFLLLAVIIPVICLVTFIACIRTPIPKRKWFWAIFSLLGVGVFNMNWTTGEVGFSMLSWQLLGAGFVRSGIYSPAILSIGAPFGAVLFWIKRREWLEPAAPDAPEDLQADDE